MGLLWWEYLVIVIAIFIGCIFLNYFVKVVNERRIEQKFYQKISTYHSVQAQEPSLQEVPLEPLNPKDESKLYTRITFVNKNEILNRSVQSLPANGFRKKNITSFISDEVNLNLSLPITQMTQNVTENEWENWIQAVIFENFNKHYDVI